MSHRVRIALVVFMAASLLPLVAPAAIHAGGPVGTSFAIRAEAQEEWQPAVAYNSQWEEYLVVFWNDRPGNDDIRAERVSRDGRLLGGRWLAAGPGAERRAPDVAYNSQRNEYLVVWQQATGMPLTSQIVSQRFSADLIARPEGAKVLFSDTPAVSVAGGPAVAYADTSDKYLVVWEWWHLLGQATTHVVAHVVGSNGQPEPAGRFLVSQDPGGLQRQNPALTYDSHTGYHLVVWQQMDGSGGWDIYGRLVYGDGTLVGLPETMADEQVDCRNPAVAALPTAPGGERFLVVWEFVWSAPTDVDIHARVVGEDATPHAPLVIAAGTGAETNPTVAGDETGMRYLVAWTQSSPGPAPGSVIAGREVSSVGAMPEPERGIEAPLADNAALVSGSAGDFLVAFDDKRHATRDIYGQLWGRRVYLPIALRRR